MRGREGTEVLQEIHILPGPDTNKGHTGGRFEMSAYTIFPVIGGLAFDGIKIREIETALKITRVEIGITELAEQARLIGEGRLEDDVRDPAAQIAIRVNAVSARIELAKLSGRFRIHPLARKVPAIV